MRVGDYITALANICAWTMALFYQRCHRLRWVGRGREKERKSALSRLLPWFLPTDSVRPLIRNLKFVSNGSRQNSTSLASSLHSPENVDIRKVAKILKIVGGKPEPRTKRRWLDPTNSETASRDRRAKQNQTKHRLLVAFCTPISHRVCPVFRVFEWASAGRPKK